LAEAAAFSDTIVSSPLRGGTLQGEISMAEQFGDKAAAAAERAGDQGRQLYERTKDKAQSAIDAGREGFEAVADEGRRQIDSLSRVVRDWPLVSVAVAFAAGCVVSRLMRGR
jgi:ElaB/YqjD/DUF883 family membrane-anchored ribosome-binding protein